MNATRQLALIGLAMSLVSCATMPGGGNAGTRPGNAPSPISSSATTSGAASSALVVQSAQDDEQQRLIDSINRDGNRRTAGYSDTPPAPVNALSTDVVELNYEQADLRVVIEELAAALDTTIIIDPSIADKVSIRTSANRPLTQEDIWPLIRLLTRQAGVTLERVGNVYYARQGDVNLPVEITTRGDTAGTTASVVTQITPLVYVSVETALEMLGPLVLPNGTLSRISNNTLAISASPSQLSRINELLAVIDADPFQNQGLHLYPLSFAAAAELAEELTEVLQLIEGNNPAYQVKGLERINALLVTAPSNRGFEEITRWVRLLDADSQEQSEQLFHYRVKNLTALDLAATLTSVFELDEEDAPVRTANDRFETVEVLTPEGETVSRTVPSLPNASVGGAGNEQAVSANIKVSIVADEATNSLLVRANPRDYRQLLATINQLDAVPLQVMINAVIAQVTLTDATRFGVDWARVAIDATNAPSSSASTSFIPNSGLGGLLFTKSFVDGAARVEATLEAIASNNEVQLLARPSLTVVNNMEGEIKIGSVVPVRSGSTTTQSGDNIISSIQYRDTGIVLSITPRINNDGVVNMIITQSLSSIQEASGVDDNPIFDNQEITTSVVVRNNENIVLGGLIQSTNSDLNSGVPGLNRIPVVGRLFSYQQDIAERKELFIVLRPEIVNLNDGNAAQFSEILSRFEMAAELFEDIGQ